jgi:hypothetical protein
MGSVSKRYSGPTQDTCVDVCLWLFLPAVTEFHSARRVRLGLGICSREDILMFDYIQKAALAGIGAGAVTLDVVESALEYLIKF